MKLPCMHAHAHEYIQLPFVGVQCLGDASPRYELTEVADTAPTDGESFVSISMTHIHLLAIAGHRPRHGERQGRGGVPVSSACCAGATARDVPFARVL